MTLAPGEHCLLQVPPAPFNLKMSFDPAIGENMSRLERGRVTKHLMLQQFGQFPQGLVDIGQGSQEPCGEQVVYS